MRYRILIFVFAIVATCATTIGQTFEESRSYSRDFMVSGKTDFEILNKYGTVQIVTGKNDSIKVRAEVVASSNNLQRMRKMLNGVAVNMTETGYSIRVQTDFSANMGFLLEDFKSITGKLIPFENRLRVNYFITVPEGTDIRIDNMFGDVYLEDVTGRLNLILSNGSIQTGAVSSQAILDLSFVNGSIKGIESGKVTASYSEISIGNSEDIELVARSSKIEMDACSKLIANTRRDKIFVGSARNINIDAYFSNISVESVADEIYLKSTYGSFTAPSISNNFTMVSATTQFTDIFLGFNQGTRAGADIKTATTTLQLPDSGVSFTNRLIGNEKNEMVIYGNIGRDNGTSRIKMDITRGSLTIKLNQ